MASAEQGHLGGTKKRGDGLDETDRKGLLRVWAGAQVSRRVLGHHTVFTPTSF